jgi:predicted phosphodiesterase
MPDRPYNGLLAIGDPHVEGRAPGFRKDDYPEVVLEKLEWCFDYAINNSLLPVILGDLFHLPRDNPNWILGRLIDLFHLHDEVIGVYGNHDVHNNPELTEHDSFSLLVKSHRIRLVSAEYPWRGKMGGRSVVVGGSSYRQPIPERYFALNPARGDGPPLTVWLTHHAINLSGSDEGWITPHEIEGVDLLINGHIHRRLEDVQAGRTLWVTPGNISRVARGDATRTHVPAVLRIDVTPDKYDLVYVEVPHRPFEEVFYDEVVALESETGASAFVAGLAELQARRTAGGAGLMEFLNYNLDQFEPAVADEIMELAREVTEHDEHEVGNDRG